MRRTSRLFNRSTDEVGWISTTDMFVVACCFLLVLAVTSKRRASEAEGQLGLATEQLELSKAAAAPNYAQKLETIVNERNELLAQLEAEKERIVSISDKRLRESASSSKEEQILSAKLKQFEDGLNAAKAEANKLKEQLEAARQAAVLMREQAISQQRSINNRLVGLGGKLENVVFMVDVSKSMQSGKGQMELCSTIGFP